ncbi:hypothetical protein [Tenacibaculum piscium]|uniref:hypothetical protein n=1 Tax=Tenacibaculum piscium TaxID=1458515 RepID=UPI001F384EFE|nr:hypothetical protein [Tenacibaculum piscium]
MIDHKRNTIILIFALIFISLKITAQRTSVVDNKGTIKNVNTSVSSGTYAPANPLEGDIWFESNPTNNKVKIYDADEPTPANRWKSISNQNIYTENGTLTGIRDLNGAGNSLFYFNLGSFQVYDTNEIQLRCETYFQIEGKLGIYLYNTTTIHEDLSLKKRFIDASNKAGTSGQILSSTGTGTKWTSNNTHPIENTTNNFILDETHHTIILDNTTPITITIPDASTAKGRIYIIKTNTLGTATLSRDYIPTDRIPLTILANSLTYHLQSDGTNWQQIN